MTEFNSGQNIGEIVTIMPKASDIFKEYNIDFCCGGNRPLSEAITEQKLNETEILTKLSDAYEQVQKGQVDYRTMASSELIDYIVNTHHVFVKNILPDLSELTTTILRVHGQNHNILFKVHKLFHSLKMELDQHLIKEEELLFPMIKNYDDNPSDDLLERIKEVVNETESEHDAAGDILKELRLITEQYKVPEDGCTTYYLTYDKLVQLESDLFQHIHLENNILFKQLGIDKENEK